MGVRRTGERRSSELLHRAPNSTGVGASISYRGSLSRIADRFRLRVEDLPPNELTVFHYGSARTTLPFFDGYACVAGRRFRLPPENSGAEGIAEHELDLRAPPASTGAGAIRPGVRWYFQAWYRDLGGPGGTGANLTDGLAVTFCR